ncbi:hypothetical protein AVEN_218449-1 [Araneus ventricosus]|uniref:Uncharacterized protein n=1 Tax=Araneus ventricosus TaxID=182803 RepID=A0A4Y2KUZ3_ARAVE|nr:hypothetical protein AVEN_218449-1 [Araneus ventricosus]
MASAVHILKLERYREKKPGTLRKNDTKNGEAFHIFNDDLRNKLKLPSLKEFILNPQLDQVQESAKGERFMVKEESAASVGRRPWTPEGRSLTLSIAFMLQLSIFEWPSRFG